MKNILIGLAGSSIMEGVLGVDKPETRYYNILQQSLSGAFPDTCFPIINSAIGGWSSRELHHLFQRDILGYPLDICIIMYGANNVDLDIPGRSLREFELDEIMVAEEGMLPRSVKRIGVILGPIIDELHWCSRKEKYRKFLEPFGGHNAFMELEREKVKAFYLKHQWPVVDLREVFASDVKSFIYKDGIHLSEAGHRAFAEALFPVVRDSLGLS